MNCHCRSDFDLRVVCQPIDDYRKLKKYSDGLKYDFRKCPQRFNYAMDFVLNNCQFARLIENAQTKTGKKTARRRFIVARKILIQKYRLPRLEAERVISNYQDSTWDNIIDGTEDDSEDDMLNLEQYGCMDEEDYDLTLAIDSIQISNE
jgi:hypothetical protein